MVATVPMAGDVDAQNFGRLYTVLGGDAKDHHQSGRIPLVIMNRSHHLVNSVLIPLTTDQQEWALCHVWRFPHIQSARSRIHDGLSILSIQEDHNRFDRLAYGIRLQPSRQTL
ncbi:MAG: hypothetical protein ABI856_09985, partial [Nitrospira sp.]